MEFIFSWIKNSLVDATPQQHGLDPFAYNVGPAVSNPIDYDSVSTFCNCYLFLIFSSCKVYSIRTTSHSNIINLQAHENYQQQPAGYNQTMPDNNFPQQNYQQQQGYHQSSTPNNFTNNYHQQGYYDASATNGFTQQNYQQSSGYY